MFVFFVSLTTLFASEKRFEKIDMASGLSHNTALCLLEDHNGFVWIGTRDGLNKYDGVNFEIYKHVFFDSTSLVSNQVNCLCETKNNEIWVGTANGLCLYHSKANKFRTTSLLAESKPFDSYYVRTIFETANGELLVGTTKGLYVIDEKRETVKFLFVQNDSTGLANNVRKIYQDKQGTIWIGTSNGLFKKNDNGFERYPFENSDGQSPLSVREIVENDEGLLWIGTEGQGIYVLNVSGEKPKVCLTLSTNNSSLPSNTVRSILFENEENVWIGTFGGLCIYNPKTQKSNVYQYSDKVPLSISNNSVQDIICDAQGGIWLAIYLGGVNYFHQQKNIFQHRLWQSGNRMEKNNVISVLLEDDYENMWIGTEGDGVYQSKDEGKTIANNLKFSDSERIENTIKSLSYGDGSLWIGTLTGLISYQLATGKIKKYYHQPGKSNSLNNGHVLALLYENDEKLWIGTNGGGVQVFNPQKSTYKNIAPLRNKHVRCFFKDSKQRIWIGCEQEVFVINNDDSQLINLSESIENWVKSEIDVIFVTEDSQKNIWFGTRGMGLYLIKNNKLFWFNTGNGLIDNTVNSLLEGSNNQFWITTNKGLSKISIEDDKKGNPKIVSRTYSVSQGVQGLQFSSNCALKSRAGKLFFGGINGLNSFAPAEIIENKINPKLVFSDLMVNYKVIQPGAVNSPLNECLNETSNLVLTYNQSDFSISFTGINFINPDKNQYRYMVSGIDDSWIEMGNQNNINFTYFPVGTHEIRVQTTTNPEQWGTDFRSLRVTVLPPWWKTWWAFLIYFVVLILLLGVFFILSQRWAKLKNKLAMQQFQSDKENELHQLKLKFYTDVSHELRTPLTLILAPLENLISKTELPNRFRNQLIQIQRSGFRLMQLVNQILDLRKLETGHEELQVAEGNIIRFFTEISLAFKEVASSKKITFEFVPHKQELSFWYDRDKLEIIVNNLLSNAFKFTHQGGLVKLLLAEIAGQEILEPFEGLNKKNHYLQINVIDNGEGIRPEDLKNIYTRFFSKKENGKQLSPNVGVGLELTKRMVELHKGGISVSSSISEQGRKETIFSIYLSLSKNVYSPEEIDVEFKNSEDRSLYTTEFLQRETAIGVQEESTGQGVTQHADEFERILIVEDNPEVRNFIKELFADDYEISEAENGETGLQKAIETNPQLIISDVMMPVMDGIELCRKVKTDARTSHIPVILLTARTALTFKYEGLETGADDYITKPFSARYLRLRVKNLIKQRQSIQEHFKREAICDPGSVTLTSVDEKILKKAMDYILTNISDPGISVNKISEHVGLSRVHFYRKIKAITNQTAVEFIRGVRLKRAATLLRQDKISVKEVRNLVGIEDADYFRKCFKEQFGVTPSEYKS